jgi:hypothetical protein
MTNALLEAGLDRCRRAGLTTTRPEDGGEPAGLARPPGTAAGDPTEDPRPFEPDRADQEPADHSVSRLLERGRPVAVEALPDPDPTVVLSRLWNARDRGRAVLLVVPDAVTAGEVEQLLAPPVGTQTGEDDCRVFYTGPDRVPLAEGGYAAAPAGTTLEWREATTALDPVGLEVRASDAEESATDRATARPAGRWLELVADGAVLARLDGVDGLDCPSRERFPYSYRRDSDKQIRVEDFAGRPVQRYPGVRAMRDGGFQPVPAPLVPEHMFDAAVDGWWAVLVAGN